MTTLYRAAPAKDPYFGRASYWSTSEDFACRYARWLDKLAAKHPDIIHGPNVVYRADVELDNSPEGNHLEFPEQLLLDSVKVTRVARKHKDGERGTWLSFREGSNGRMAVWEGQVVPRNYVYLGDEPVEAVQVEVASSSKPVSREEDDLVPGP
jgi:hypothetical protein